MNILQKTGVKRMTLILEFLKNAFNFFEIVVDELEKHIFVIIILGSIFYGAWYFWSYVGDMLDIEKHIPLDSRIIIALLIMLLCKK